MTDMRNMTKKGKVLIVDDEKANIVALTHILAPDYTVYAAKSGQDGIETVKEHLPDVVLLDIRMPDMDGYEVLSILKSMEKTQQIPVIFVTGLSNAVDEEKGLALGAADYIAKPFVPAIVKLRVQNQFSQLRQLSMIVELRDVILDTIAELVERRDNVTGGHIERTQSYLRLLIRLLLENGIYADELSTWDVDLFILSSQLHDVGKISIQDSILLKPGKLTREEYENMKEHVSFGNEIIDGIKGKTNATMFLRHATLLTGSHHEKWNGTGYPLGLKGEEIPLQGRLMALADVYDALTSGRPYKKAFPHSEALKTIKMGMGTHFDPLLCETFIRHEKEFESLLKRL